ncbi:uncharacterized protein ColSpa_05769 [Colletotrichum spaethianum]|uniref:Uncharacterized protein n=1 Tax=Colletotrichum spaethianum TaxID=700344 RepID=A0AA37LFM1_9PEZI|nr:uncharacterized protein ColSpa_05769 [Colletotrichum spaethianum]GKT45588.1 hypothetical protein ColSpa_05769 [Colletotrichum spaethianum]
MASFFTAAAALLPLAKAQTSTRAEAALITASARPFFIFDTHPTGSLEASIVAYNRENATYHVACPTADAACKKEGYWPATVTHIEGSSWLGTNTATAGIEKQWRCRLGSSSSDVEVIPDQYGQCYVTTIDAAGSTTVDPVMPVDLCFLSAHSVVVAVTAGLEKVEAVHPIVTEDEYNPSALLSYCDLRDVYKPGTVYRVGVWGTYDWGYRKGVVADRDRKCDDGGETQVGDRSRHRDGNRDGCGVSVGVDVRSGEWVWPEVEKLSVGAGGGGRRAGRSLVIGGCG